MLMFAVTLTLTNLKQKSIKMIDKHIDEYVQFFKPYTNEIESFWESTAKNSAKLILNLFK